MLTGKEDITLKTVTAAYFGVAILGFLTSGNTLLGLVHINEADRWLHLGLAIAMLLGVFIATSPSRVQVTPARNVSMAVPTGKSRYRGLVVRS